MSAEHLDNFTRVQYAVLSSMVLLSLDALRAGNIVQVVSVSAFKYIPLFQPILSVFSSLESRFPLCSIPILFYSIIQRCVRGPPCLPHGRPARLTSARFPALSLPLVWIRVNGFDAFFNQMDSNGSLSSCGGAAGFEAVEESPCFPARQAYDKHVPLLTAAPVVIGLAQISYVWLTYALAKEFG